MLKQCLQGVVWSTVGLLAVPFVSWGQSVTLSWEPSCSQNVTGYELCYGPESKRYVACQFVGQVLSVTYDLSSLEPGTTFYETVVAVGDDPHLDSDYSNEVVVTVPQTSCQSEPFMNPPQYQE